MNSSSSTTRGPWALMLSHESPLRLRGPYRGLIIAPPIKTTLVLRILKAAIALDFRGNDF